MKSLDQMQEDIDTLTAGICAGLIILFIVLIGILILDVIIGFLVNISIGGITYGITGL